MKNYTKQITFMLTILAIATPDIWGGNDPNKWEEEAITIKSKLDDLMRYNRSPSLRTLFKAGLTH
jgi:hypothetical protein